MKSTVIGLVALTLCAILPVFVPRSSSQPTPTPTPTTTRVPAVADPLGDTTVTEQQGPKRTVVEPIDS